MLAAHLVYVAHSYLAEGDDYDPEGVAVSAAFH
jgi:hypothetical protein